MRAAENQLPFIEEQANKRVATEKKLLTERLSTARDFLEEKPQQAKSICEAICVLYRNKSWADSLVQQAKQLLKENTRTRGAASYFIIEMRRFPVGSACDLKICETILIVLSYRKISVCTAST